MFLYVYELRKDGQKLGRLHHATCGPRHADVRVTWHGPQPTVGNRKAVATAQLLNDRGFDVAEPLHVVAIVLRGTGMLLKGYQRSFRANTPKSKSMVAAQSWFCAAQPLALPSVEDMQTGRWAMTDAQLAERQRDEVLFGFSHLDDDR